MAQCNATNRQGQPCRQPAIKGGSVCKTHGGSAPQVLAKARQRLLEAADSAAAELVRQSQDKKLPASDRRAAVLALLDRAGLNPKQAIEHTGADGGPIEAVIRVEFAEPVGGLG